MDFERTDSGRIDKQENVLSHDDLRQDGAWKTGEQSSLHSCGPWLWIHGLEIDGTTV